jgi:uncharacterized RDD family membrane protein YckC
MKNIEIITTQNVVLQYELASLQDRALAFLLDLICMGMFMITISAPLSAAANSETGGMIAGFIFICIFLFYSLLFEVFNKGRSIGKMAMKIQVIKLAGGSTTFSDYAARWAFRMIDIYFSMGAVAATLVLSSSKAQRIGDIIANTAVVKTQPKMNIDLQDLLSIHQTNKYIPKYLQARKLREQDALLIKSALERYRRFNNVPHKEAIKLLSDHVQRTLGIDQVAEEQTIFLQTILKDYVVLSR